jgi:hypothetical protein
VRHHVIENSGDCGRAKSIAPTVSPTS